MLIHKLNLLPIKGYKSSTQAGTKSKGGWNKAKSIGYQKNLRCFMCNSPNHLAWDCKNHKISSESRGKKITQKNPNDVDMIRTKPKCSNKGKESQHVKIRVPVTGLIDTGSDITIMWGDLSYHIVGKAGIEADQLQSPAHKACTYDQKPITLDGQMEMTLSFQESITNYCVC